MGIFGNSSPFDQDIERVTSENNTSGEDWAAILEICDRAGASAAAARDCLRATLRRLAHADPHVQVQAATLLDACVANCGRAFLLEVASRDFDHEFRRLVARAQPPVAAKLRALLRKWAENEFRDDPQLDIIPALYRQLRADADSAASDAPPPQPAAAAAAAAAAEDEELARAIALSLRDAPPAAAAAPLYPRMDADAGAPLPAAAPAAPAAPAPRQVRALYDFEAAEDNELTFLAGEIVLVTDSSDPNWWKGQNARGEGLFPANFVTADLAPPAPVPTGAPTGAPASALSGALQPAHNECEEGVGGEADAALLDAALALLLDADPESAGEDEPRVRAAEERAARVGARVDAALERADRTHARLTQLSAELVRALNLYHDLMRDPYAPLYAGPQPHPPPPAAPHHPQPQMYHQHLPQHPPRC